MSSSAAYFEAGKEQRQLDTEHTKTPQQLTVEYAKLYDEHDRLMRDADRARREASNKEQLAEGVRTKLDEVRKQVAAHLGLPEVKK